MYQVVYSPPTGGKSFFCENDSRFVDSDQIYDEIAGVHSGAEILAHYGSWDAALVALADQVRKLAPKIVVCNMYLIADDIDVMAFSYDKDQYLDHIKKTSRATVLFNKFGEDTLQSWADDIAVYVSKIENSTIMTSDEFISDYKSEIEEWLLQKPGLGQDELSEE